MKNNFLGLRVLILSVSVAVFSACSSASADQSATMLVADQAIAPATAAVNAENAPVVILSKIEIQSGSPSERIRNFYKLIREKKFVDAMMMTNMKAAVEGLTLEDARELAPDFEPLAAQVPLDLIITGEQISGEKASVFLRLPGDGSNANPTTDEIKLRKEGEAWVILSGDDKDEASAKKQGKAYFFNVRIDVHHQEVEFMLERIVKAQAIFTASTKGLYGSTDTLIRQGLLPPDVNSSYSTGYNFSIVLSDGNKSYFVNAVPATYGKSGKLSFLMEVTGQNEPKTKSKDTGGMPLKR